MNNRINWAKITPTTAVWCKTEEEARAFCKAAKEKYPERCCAWECEETNWNDYKDEMCYTLSFEGRERLGYGSKAFYVRYDYTIIPFSDLLSDEPRICEVLGVEVGAVFSVRAESGELRRFVVQGIRLHHVRDDGSPGNRANNMSLWLIEHPDRIIRQPRFTDDELATMRVLYAAGIRTVERDKYATLWMGDDGRAKSTALPYGMFPSIRPGESVSIAEATRDAK